MSGVLVTGAGGLLGSATCRLLAGRGLPFIPVRREDADLTEAHALDDVAPPASVIHTAAVLPSSFEDSAQVASLNRRMDDAVLAAADRWGARVVYTSSASVYGTGHGEPFDESAEIAPRGAYLNEKARTEELGAAAGVPFTSLRVNAPYGPGQRARTVIHLWVERARAGGPLEYFGSGSREQTFTWADDVAEALVAALDGPAGTYNVAGGGPTTMRDLAHLIAGAAGLGPDAVRASSRPDPQEGTLARYDISLAGEALGWTPRTSLRAGIEAMLEAPR